MMLTMMSDDATAKKLDELQAAAQLELNPKHPIVRGIEVRFSNRRAWKKNRATQRSDLATPPLPRSGCLETCHVSTNNRRSDPETHHAAVGRSVGRSISTAQAARNSPDEGKRRVARLVAEQVFDNARISAGALDDPREMVGRIHDILELALDIPTHEEEDK